jgi:hypothetical protein
MSMAQIPYILRGLRNAELETASAEWDWQEDDNPLLGEDYRTDWDRLLVSSTQIVCLAAPTRSGKSRELAELKKCRGLPLITATEALDSWRGHAADAEWLMIDALDELMLARRTVDALLRRLAAADDAVLADRAVPRLILAARTGFWSAELRTQLGDYGSGRAGRLRPSPQKEAQLVRFLRFGTIPRRAVVRLARGAGIPPVDAEAFASALMEEGYLSETLAPEEVIGLAGAWIPSERRLPTPAVMWEGISVAKLAEANTLHRSESALSGTEIREAAERLAAATTTTGVPFIEQGWRPRGGGSEPVRADTIAGLPEKEVPRLLQRPAFVSKGEDAVQFAPAELEAYLAGRWTQRRATSASARQLWREMTVGVPGHAPREVPGAWRAWLAWAATLVPALRASVLATDPSIALLGGDISLWTDGEREHAIVRRFEHCARRDPSTRFHPRRHHLRRALTPALVPWLETQLERAADEPPVGDPDKAPRHLHFLLEVAQASGAPSLSSGALRVFRETGHPDAIRLHALRAAKACADRGDFFAALGAQLANLGPMCLWDVLRLPLGELPPAQLADAIVRNSRLGLELFKEDRGDLPSPLARALLSRVGDVLAGHDDRAEASAVFPLLPHVARPGLLSKSGDERAMALAAVDAACACFEGHRHDLPREIFEKLSDSLDQDGRRVLWISRRERGQGTWGAAPVPRLCAADVGWLAAIEDGSESDRIDLALAFGRGSDAEQIATLADTTLPEAARAFLEHRRLADAAEANHAREMLAAQAPSLASTKTGEPAGLTWLPTELDAIASGADEERLLTLCGRPEIALCSSFLLSAESLRAALVRVLGPACGAACEAGLLRLWRRPELPAAGRTTESVETAMLVAIAGAALELGTASAVAALPRADRDQATDLMQWGIGAFPPWFGLLWDVDTGAVSARVGDWLKREAGREDSAILMLVAHLPPKIRAKLRPRVISSAGVGAIASPLRLERLRRALRIADVNEHSAGELEALTGAYADRFAHASTPDESAVWIFELALVDPGRALGLLRESDEDAIFFRVASEFVGHGGVLQLWVRNSPFLLPAHVRDWVSYLFGRFPPSDDPQHGDSIYSPSPLDRAADFRSYFLRALINDVSPESLQAMASLQREISTPDGIESLWWARSEQLSNAATATFRAQATAALATVCEPHAAPASHEQLADLVFSHLEEIGLDATGSDLAYPELVARAENEGEAKRWLAERLRERARDAFQVGIEEEVAQGNKPDITVHAGSVLRVPIEVKLSRRWSIDELRIAIEEQLVGRYLRPARATRGFFVVVWNEARTYPELPITTPDGLRTHLQDMASDFCAKIDGFACRVEVVVIDLLEGRKPPKRDRRKRGASGHA